MSGAPSLFRHLLAWTLGALALVLATYIVVGYRTGLHEADELTDGHLASVAALLLSQRSVQFKPAPGAAEIGGLPELKAHDYQQSLSIVVWDHDGQVLARSGSAPLPAFDPDEGFQTAQLGNPPQRWRVFSRWDAPDHGRKVMVMLSMAERDELAEDIAGLVAEPGLWLLPVVALVLTLAIRRGLRPLRDFRRDVDALDIQRDTAIRTPRHRELRAVAAAIDHLIARYNEALARERELASEVAHELRTPLASLRLHAASLPQLPPAERREALDRVVRDAERAAAVLNDLLALARASRAELAERQQPVELAELARRVVADFAGQAMQSGHELAVDAPDTCIVAGHAVLLELALRNLVENALSHTPAGTSIEVRVLPRPPMLEVRDNGSGAAGAPAGRNLGLGLGHQVARKVAAVHGGTFERGDADGGRAYRIRLPAPAT